MAKILLLLCKKGLLCLLTGVHCTMTGCLLTHAFSFYCGSAQRHFIRLQTGIRSFLVAHMALYRCRAAELPQACGKALDTHLSDGKVMK
jgi:hypothetical protein